MEQALETLSALGRAARMCVTARRGRFHDWPSNAVLIDEPLAMAEARTGKLRRIYANAGRDLWDGPTLFREAMAKHGGIQLEREKREALSHILTMLMWGELAAWIISAQLAERLDDPDARMAASSQVFDEARHFYTLRDYVAALHVPVPPLDPYFATAARAMLDEDDLNLKLMAMQLLAEGTAQTIFDFLADAEVEPVLSELLPYIERDEARHVGLGIMHLPDRLAQLDADQCRRIARKVMTIGDLFAATQIRFIPHYDTLGLDPRELFRRADKMLHGLSQKLGTVPGTGVPYFRTFDPTSPSYQKQLDFVLPPKGRAPSRSSRLLHRAVELGARAMTRGAAA
ncbi:MAG: ferritin-like domain-containing protein [Myxococcota bacterium]